MPTEQEVRHYLEKSGDDRFCWEWALYEFDEGWFNYFVQQPDAKFCIGQAYGSHQAIAREARNLARFYQCKCIIFTTARNARAFERLTGARIIAAVLELPLEVNENE